MQNIKSKDEPCRIINLDWAYAQLLAKGNERAGHCYLAWTFQLKEWQWQEKWRIHNTCPHCEGTGECP